MKSKESFSDCSCYYYFIGQASLKKAFEEKFSTSMSKLSHQSENKLSAESNERHSKITNFAAASTLPAKLKKKPTDETRGDIRGSAVINLAVKEPPAEVHFRAKSFAPAEEKVAVSQIIGQVNEVAKVAARRGNGDVGRAVSLLERTGPDNMRVTTSDNSLLHFASSEMFLKKSFAACEEKKEQATLTKLHSDQNSFHSSARKGAEKHFEAPSTLRLSTRHGSRLKQYRWGPSFAQLLLMVGLWVCANRMTSLKMIAR